MILVPTAIASTGTSWKKVVVLSGLHPKFDCSNGTIRSTSDFRAPPFNNCAAHLMVTVAQGEDASPPKDRNSLPIMCTW
eukprot:CAMPEP_0202368130 /NCGR_PEP_ID=MMETSP1127-20130417/319_1 /ASSEMBLY_ACC=CAM_ASM_000462 /TAXON_ID=3047 /ORGANISM="Dunaliella tertiolecta, Strain CCMP1320" /LENGTH=78 /DNA_ID=CAMNT_0048963491 /DNA_START=361 /DNA_END=594 /DNA_ORIENTATION=-